MRAISRLACCACLMALILTARATAPCHPAPHSNIGREFYAVSLPNAFTDQSTYPFGIRALNPSNAATANLQISGGGLASAQSQPVTPGSAVDVQLPWVGAVSNSTATVLVAAGAYHVVSDAPVSVAQFNDDSGTSESSDATLLMPVQNAGTSFMVAAWPEWEFSGAALEEPAQICVVATAAATNVQINALNIQAGAGLTATGGSVQMNAGDVLLVSSALASAVDISGTRIVSDAPILVFTAHAGTEVPSATGYADHLEDALPPLSDLGQEYLLVRPGSPGGGADAKQSIKLTGTVDNTNIAVDPSVIGVPTALNAGQSVTFEATVDVHIQADQPILVSQFMEGASAFSGSGTAGDPSQLTAIPTNRGALSLDFIAPMSFAPIYAQVIAPTGASVILDGSAVSGWSAIGSSGYSGANISLCCADVHHASGNQPFTLSAYAYPSTGGTSYWYAGGVGPSDDIFGDGFE
jgi:hypothetical protein